MNGTGHHSMRGGSHVQENGGPLGGGTASTFPMAFRRKTRRLALPPRKGEFFWQWVGRCHAMHSPPSSSRPVDYELESEDEEAIIERRRKMRTEIMRKYQQSDHQNALDTPPVASSMVSSAIPSPNLSDTESEDSDVVGNTAAVAVADDIHREEEKGEGLGVAALVAKEGYQDSPLPVALGRQDKSKEEQGEDGSGDMFGERYIVRASDYCWL